MWAAMPGRDAGKGSGGKVESGIAADLRELYGLPPGEFTAARKRLAARLRQAGQGAAAKRVAELARPTASAWAVNQLLRREGARVAELLAAGERARATQQRVLSGKLGAGALQQSAREVRELVEALARRAAELAGEGGTRVGALTGERIAADLEAMALDPAGAEAVAGGWLERDLERPGLNVLAGARLPAGARPGEEWQAEREKARRETVRKGRPQPSQGRSATDSRANELSPKERQATKRQAAERRKAERQAAAEREKAARRQEAERREAAERDQRAAAARERIAGAEREVRRVGAEVETARRELREAAAGEAEATRLAREAQAALQQARRRVTEVERALARARSELGAAWRRGGS